MDERVQLDPREIILGAANVTVGMMNDARLTRMTQNLLTILTDDLADEVQPTDRAGLFMAVQFELGNRLELGAILVLDDRALFSWFTGTFRRKTFLEVVKLTSINEIARQDKKGVAQLDIATADRRWVVIPFHVEGERTAGMLRGVLDGSLKPQFSD